MARKRALAPIDFAPVERFLEETRGVTPQVGILTPSEEAALVGRVSHLERAVRALVRRVHGSALPGCTQCRRYAERQVQVSNPRGGMQSQNLCGSCPPKHPLLDRRDTVVTELPLATSALARAANSDLDSILEAGNG